MKVGIVGYGHVGQAMRALFKEAVIYDKFKNIGTQDEINKCDAVFVCVPTPQSENGMCDTSWWDNFIKYYDGVLEKSDGYVDEPETLICELAPTQTLKIEFHPGDTVYFINDKQIACTGGHYNIQVIPFKELLNSIKNRQIFLLLLPLAVIDNQDKDKATQIVSNVLQEIFDKHLCNQYAGCIVTGLMSE